MRHPRHHDNQHFATKLRQRRPGSWSTAAALTIALAAVPLWNGTHIARVVPASAGDATLPMPSSALYSAQQLHALPTLPSLGDPPPPCFNLGEPAQCPDPSNTFPNWLPSTYYGQLHDSMHIVKVGQQVTSTVDPLYPTHGVSTTIQWQPPGDSPTCASDTYSCTWKVTDATAGLIRQGQWKNGWGADVEGVCGFFGCAPSGDYMYVTTKNVVSGTVVDPDGLPVPNVEITISGSAASGTEETDASGFYSAVVPAGTYTVSASLTADGTTLTPEAQSCTPGSKSGADCSVSTKNVNANASFLLKIPAATLTWHMKRRFSTSNTNSNGTIHYYTDPSEVTPPDWDVIATVKNVGSKTCSAAVDYGFEALSGPQVPDEGETLVAVKRHGCKYDVRFPQQGDYSVEVVSTVGTNSVTGQPVTVSPRDLLLIGIGDSVGSGEGNPDIPGPIHNTWEDYNCDRSAYSFEPQASLALSDQAEKLGTASVTFVHLACSGASIDDGILTRSDGFHDLKSLPSQIDQAATLANGRPIDGVLVSAGANDLGFGTIVTYCVLHANCPSKHTSDMDPILESELGLSPSAAAKLSLSQAVQDLVNNLPNDYANLNAAITSTLQVPANHVFISQYFDPTRNGAGKFCSDAQALGGLPNTPIGITEKDVKWAYHNVVVPLNAAVSAAATKYGWQLNDGVQAAFHVHGYCSADSWVVTLPQSFAYEGGPSGALHPNHDGHQAIAKLLEALLTHTMLPNGQPVALNPNPPS